jgi:quercetin dioxygenase-like cupin family protein
MGMKPVVKNAEVKQVNRSGREMDGIPLGGSSFVRLMMTGSRMQLKELYLTKGFEHPRHNHPGEESIGYLIKGRLKMGIGDEEYELRDGDSWHHPDGAFHWTIAMEDSYAVEVHAPPRPAENV